MINDLVRAMGPVGLLMSILKQYRQTGTAFPPLDTGVVKKKKKKTDAVSEADRLENS